MPAPAAEETQVQPEVPAAFPPPPTESPLAVAQRLVSIPMSIARGMAEGMEPYLERFHGCEEDLKLPTTLMQESLAKIQSGRKKDGGTGLVESLFGMVVALHECQNAASLTGINNTVRSLNFRPIKAKDMMGNMLKNLVPTIINMATGLKDTVTKNWEGVGRDIGNNWRIMVLGK